MVWDMASKKAGIREPSFLAVNWNQSHFLFSTEVPLMHSEAGPIRVRKSLLPSLLPFPLGLPLAP